MRFHRSLSSFALVTAATLSSCALEEGVQPLATYRYDVPIADHPTVFVPEGCWDDNTDIQCPILIQRDGALTHQNVAIEPSDIDAIERRRPHYAYGNMLTVAAHPSATSADVVARLSEMFPDTASPETAQSTAFDVRARTVIDLPPFALVELEESIDNVGQPSPHTISEFEQRGFLGRADEYALPIWVGYSQKADKCIIKTGDGEAVASADLFDKAFEHLDWVVQDMGGVEFLVEEPDMLDRLIARVQSDEATPWRCIAAATYNIERAGWLEINFEVFADTSVGGES